VTKYNPEYRNKDGSYSSDEWVSYSDIGKSVSEDEYINFENSYIESALKFLEEQNISSLSIKDLENTGNSKEPGAELTEGKELDLESLRKVIKSILREKYWAKLESDNSFIHIGYDYYMYIGVPNEASESKKYAASKGLFVEEFQSPYYENGL
jgi:hypothetical protein